MQSKSQIYFYTPAIAGVSRSVQIGCAKSLVTAGPISQSNLID